ncbi:cell division protein FtsA [Candidatus Gottesmanbacteria bacterium]|nr:cell division protein FtsA [Candidatus Gottesmanbacteria bacterium]
MAKDKLMVGIDVGTSKISTVIATHKENQINVIGVSTIASKGLRKGQVVDIEEAVANVSLSLEAAERMSGVSVSSAYVSLGGIHISSQNSKGVVAVAEPDKEITEDDTRRVIEASRAISLPSVREILHAIPRHFIVDSQEGIADPIGMTGVRLEVDTHIITGSSTAARNLAKCIEELGVSVDGLVFSGLASSYAVLSDTEKELGVISVDIGGGTTDMCIFIDGSVAYSAVIPVGARNITNDLAIGLRVSLESAEKIKLALSQKQKLPTFPAEHEEKSKKEETSKDDFDFSELNKRTLVEGIIKPRLMELFTLVGLELQKSGLAGQTPAGVVLTGGGAETVGIIEACKQRLSLPVRVASTVGVSGLIDELQSPSSATAIGLLIYGSKEESEERKGMSFIPNFSGLTSKIPLKGIAKRIIDLVKSFLP